MQPKSEDRLISIVEKIMPEVSPQSVSVHVSIEQIRGNARLTLEQDYAELPAGDRFFDEVMAVADGRTNRKTSYCDGSKCANVRYNANSIETPLIIELGHDFMSEARFGFRDAPPPLRYNYVGLVAIQEALPTAERQGEEIIIGRRCNLFHFRDVGPAKGKQSLVYALDDETSIPLKVSAYANPSQILERSPNWVWEAASFDTVSGHHIPLSSTYRLFAPGVQADSSGVARPVVMTQTISVKEVTFNTVIPKATFWPSAYPPGVTVLDGLRNRSYVVPGKTASEAGPPIRVVEPGYNSWPVGVGLTLSLIALVAAFVLRRRAR